MSSPIPDGDHVSIIQMMPAQPGMYALTEEKANGKHRRLKYELVVMWVLLEIGKYTKEGYRDIIGLTATDLANHDLTHKGYVKYTTDVPKDSPNVFVVR